MEQGNLHDRMNVKHKQKPCEAERDHAGADSVVVVLRFPEMEKERRAESDQFHSDQQL